MPARTLSTETLTVCPVCGAATSAPFLQVADGYLTELNLHKCSRCSVVFLSPRLTMESVVLVENESTVYDYPPEQIAEAIDTVLPPMLSWVASFRKSDGKRLLDIGCNRGFLLEVARRQGWQVTGIEIASEAAGRARADYGLTIYASADELPPDQTFDVITAWHVLEHTFDPVAFLTTASSRLADGGVLAIQVPSFDFVDEYRSRGQAGGLLCSVHNFYFTLESMRDILERSGLHVLHLENSAEYLLLTAIATRRLPRRGVVARLQTWLGI